MSIKVGPKGASKKEVPIEKPTVEEAVVEEVHEVPVTTQEYALGNPNGYMYLEVELENVALGAEAVKIAVMTMDKKIFFGHITDDEELKRQNVLEGDVWQVYGSKKTVAAQFNFWLNEYIQSGVTQAIQFVCNVSTYKFPAFLDVITNGEGITKLQSWITPVCYDLTIDICNAVAMFTPSMKEYPLHSAFKIDNKELLYAIKSKDFEIKADEKVMNDLIITSVLHKYIWNLE